MYVKVLLVVAKPKNNTTIVDVHSMLHFFVEQIVYFSEEVFTTETVEIRLGLIMKNGEL